MVSFAAHLVARWVLVGSATRNSENSRDRDKEKLSGSKAPIGILLKCFDLFNFYQLPWQVTPALWLSHWPPVISYNRKWLLNMLVVKTDLISRRREKETLTLISTVQLWTHRASFMQWATLTTRGQSGILKRTENKPVVLKLSLTPHLGGRKNFIFHWG